MHDIIFILFQVTFLLAVMFAAGMFAALMTMLALSEVRNPPLIQRIAWALALSCAAITGYVGYHNYPLLS